MDECVVVWARPSTAQRRLLRAPKKCAKQFPNFFLCVCVQQDIACVRLACARARRFGASSSGDGVCVCVNGVWM